MANLPVHVPQDEGIHKDDVEWWYWNGHLLDDEGREYAFMFTLFKFKPLSLKAIWFTHSIVLSVADVSITPRIEYHLTGLDEGSFPGTELIASAKGGFSMKKQKKTYELQTKDLKLQLQSLKSPLLIGGDGLVNLKTANTYYYSLPRLSCKGTITIDKKPIRVQGIAWMDHQWNPTSFSSNNVWRWFSIQLENGVDLQVFEFGKQKKTRLASVSLANGTNVISHRVKISPVREPTWTSTRTGAHYPMRWHISVPDLEMDFFTEAKIGPCEMLFGPLNYWEGPQRVQGTIRGEKVSGDAFFELVGIPRHKSLPRIAADEASKRMMQEYERFTAVAGRVADWFRA